MPSQQSARPCPAWHAACMINHHHPHTHTPAQTLMRGVMSLTNFWYSEGARGGFRTPSAFMRPMYSGLHPHWRHTCLSVMDLVWRLKTWRHLQAPHGGEKWHAREAHMQHDDDMHAQPSGALQSIDAFRSNVSLGSQYWASLKFKQAR